MLTSSRAFSTFSELNENVENNNIEKIRRISVDSDIYRPSNGHTSKLNQMELLRLAIRRKQFDIVKIHLGTYTSCTYL